MADPWTKRRAESKEAFDAFQHYLREGSIDAAYARAKPDQNQIGKRAPAQWFQWSAKYEWVARAAAYADHLAEQDRLLWEERRRHLREQDWSQAEEVRSIITDALPYARGFVRRQVNVIRRPGQTTTIITEEFDIAALALVLEKASKVQRLASDQPTENINNLSGAALDAAIARALDELSDRGQAGHAPAPADEADADGGAARGDPPL